MSEQIIFVDEQGEPTGETGDKLASHNANTRLHLAFSCYVFNDKGEFLVTRRALSKKVWPGVWTNSVCGHPAPGESMEAAMVRRLDYELGMTASDFEVLLPTYTYKTPPFRGIVEHEFCPVYIARATSPVRANPDEVEEYKWLPWDEYVQMLEADNGEVYSWWCKDQLKQLKANPLIKQYSQPKSVKITAK
jgi:isopentenyl-diphosphate delta-isomerase